LIVPDIEEFEQMISAGGEQPVAVLVPLAVHHRVLVRVDRRQDLKKSVKNIFKSVKNIVKKG
jgi:hypothetical protein